MDCILKRPETVKVLEEDGGKASCYCSGQWFFGYDTRITGRKRNKVNKYEYFKLNDSAQQRTYEQNEKESYGIGNNILKPYIW